MHLLTLALALALQQHTMPAGMTNQDHQRQMEMKRHGAQAMGFDQDKTLHHFSSTAAGGSIEVSVKDPADETSRAAIRAHLKEIAASFAKGNFEKPFQTHGEVPPGVVEMQRLRAAITYKYEETSGGGAVRISTADPAALAAVHEFLAYQGREHHPK